MLSRSSGMVPHRVCRAVLFPHAAVEGVLRWAAMGTAQPCPLFSAEVSWQPVHTVSLFLPQQKLTLLTKPCLLSVFDGTRPYFLALCRQCLSGGVSWIQGPSLPSLATTELQRLTWLFVLFSAMRANALRL
jgi:hypothetical protein